jgi:hypothetical protein
MNNKMMHPIEPEEVMAYLDGELASDRAAATAAHLGECAECQGLAASLRSVSQNLKTWEVEAPESAVPATVAAALAANRPSSRRTLLARRSWREFLGQRWPVVAWVGAVAVVLLVSFGTVTFQSRPAKFTSVASQMAQQVPAPPPPGAMPAQGKEFDKLQQFSRLQSTPRVAADSNGLLHGFVNNAENSFSEDGQAMTDQQGKVLNSAANGPMIIRTAELSLITKEFDKARGNLETILKRHRGYVGELKAGGSAGSGRTLSATLRVPADQLDATLAEVKTLGRVESESQGGQDVTSQYVDLQARLTNARNTEERLTDLLRNRTGKLSDVLEVERELDRVRGEIEQMEAERKNMANQVSFATLNATISEDYKAELQVVPPSTSTRLGNAAVEGYRSVADGIVGLVLFLLSTGPSLLLWGAILFWPARLVWKKVRRSFAA